MRSGIIFFVAMLLAAGEAGGVEGEGGIFASANVLTIKMKPTGGNFNTSVSGAQFGIKYLTAYGITFSAPVNLTGIYFEFSTEVYSGPYSYRIYSWASYATLNWTQNTEYPVVQFTINGGTGTGDFTLVSGEGDVQSNDPNYYFESLSGVTGGYSNEVYQSTAINVPLPAQLRSFTASLRGAEVKLRWTTQTEADNYGFEVERSFDRMEWTARGLVEGRGVSNVPINYAYADRLTDSELLNKSVSYRLRQIDRDGAFEYSDVVDVALIANSVLPVLHPVHPNPAQGIVSAAFALGEEGAATLRLYNALGGIRRMLLDGSRLSAGAHTIRVQTSDLPAGTYYLTLEAGKTTLTTRFTVLR